MTTAKQIPVRVTAGQSPDIAIFSTFSLDLSLGIGFPVTVSRLLVKPHSSLPNSRPSMFPLEPAVSSVSI